MRKLILLIAIALAASSPAFASEETNVVATVHQFLDSFNQGDTKTALGACADSMAIIDEFLPHVWQGPGAATNWFADFDADAKKNEITDEVVTAGKPRHVDVTADRAYVVMPANYAYKQHGQPVLESGSTLTVALQNTPGGWRITGWAWAKH